MQPLKDIRAFLGALHCFSPMLELACLGFIVLPALIGFLTGNLYDAGRWAFTALITEFFILAFCGYLRGYLMWRDRSLDRKGDPFSHFLFLLTLLGPLILFMHKPTPQDVASGSFRMEIGFLLAAVCYIIAGRLFEVLDPRRKEY